MHPAAFKILLKIMGLYPFAEVVDPLPLPLHPDFTCVTAGTNGCGPQPFVPAVTLPPPH